MVSSLRSASFGNADEANRCTLKFLIDEYYRTSYKSLRTIAQAVLGSHYDDLKQFYRNVVLTDEYQHIVFVARRSIGLAELFFIILWHEENSLSFRDRLEACWAKSTSDSTIMSYAGEIAQSLKLGQYPKILIVDDLLVQGNGLNELLTTIESNVIRELQLISDTADADKYWQDIVNAISIRVFAQNSKVSIVNLQYQLQLKPAYCMVPKDWHDLSRRISALISFAGMANATFIMGAEQPIGTVEREMLNTGLALDSDTILKPVTESRNSFHERHYFSWTDPNHPLPRFYCSLRLIKNQFTNHYLLMPFIFLPQLSDRSYDLLKKQIAEKWGIGAGNSALFCDDTKTSRLEYEAMILHLSESLLMCWTKAAELPLLRKNYIPTKIALNYGINRYRPLISKDVFYRLTDPHYLFTWEELVQLLSEVTQDAPALVTANGTTDISEQAIRNQIEDTIYQTKLQELTVSYQSSQNLSWEQQQALDSSIPAVHKQTNWNILLEEFTADICGKIRDIPADILFRCLLTSMDYGIITLKARQGISRFTQVLRMSEQALFLWPARYARYYPTLSYLEERVARLDSNFTEELRTFLNHLQSQNTLESDTDADTLTAELTKYLTTLRDSGQEPEDWDIGFEKPLILDIYSVQADSRLRRLYSQERMDYMEATRIRRTLFNSCHTFYPL